MLRRLGLPVLHWHDIYHSWHRGRRRWGQVVARGEHLVLGHAGAVAELKPEFLSLSVLWEVTNDVRMTLWKADIDWIARIPGA